MPPPPLRPAVFLDRDGTLNYPIIHNGKPHPPATLDEFTLLEGVAKSCARLKAAGFVLIVATNQPDVGRGTQAQAVVEAMHAQLRQLVPGIDHIEVCYDPGGEAPPSRRRKPAPGMLFDATLTLGLDLVHSWMVGDRWRDVDCGHSAGCRTIFIDFGYREKLRARPDFVVSNFAAAVGTILAHRSINLVQ
jgi:D-glycero-D-manno-heptose 1,7-bisphosphate phosphatase